ncbi:MAG: cupin domain-containing protein [Spirochaetes bacterium]|nr:cupin domain-containing protein [Spirochaetota bacterium]
MSILTVARKKDLAFKSNGKGFSFAEALHGCYEEVVMRSCRLQAGSEYMPDLYGEKTQIFFFTKGSGYVTRPATAHNITEEAVFVPLFDKEKFSIRAGEDLEFVEILVKLTTGDIDKMNKMRMTLPHFRLHHACDRYEEDFKGAGMISRSIIHHGLLGRSSMGSVYAVGPNLNGEHSHEDLEQYFFGLDKARFTFNADGESVVVEEGDFTHIPKKARHSMKAEKGALMSYVWYEIVNTK